MKLRGDTIVMIALTARTRCGPRRTEPVVYEPGVDHLGFYWVGEELQKIPTARSTGQTPNVQLRWRRPSTSPRPNDDYRATSGRLLRFVHRLHGPPARSRGPGKYDVPAHRATTAAAMWLDGEKVLDHDGLHGALVLRGHVSTLEKGYHALVCPALREQGRLRSSSLEWRPPGEERLPPASTMRNRVCDAQGGRPGRRAGQEAQVMTKAVLRDDRRATAVPLVERASEPTT